MTPWHNAEIQRLVVFVCLDALLKSLPHYSCRQFCTHYVTSSLHVYLSVGMVAVYGRIMTDTIDLCGSEGAS